MTESRGDLWTTGPGPSGSASTVTRDPAEPDAGPDTGTDAAPVGVPVGATARVGPRAGARWWPWVVVALLATAALMIGLAVLGSGADDAPATPAAPAAGPFGAPPAPASPGSLVAGAASLFEAAQPGGRGLAPLSGQTAIGRAVPVQSVAADEGFWIGADATDRVWVLLTSDDESGVTIAEGQLLDLSGPVVTHGPEFARKAGVSADEGAEQLTLQGAHLEVDPSQVKVVGTR